MVDFVAGFDPSTGQLLWRHPHRTDYGLNITTPIWGEDNVLFVSSAYGSGSRALRLSVQNGITRVEEEWFTNRMRLHFGNAIRIAWAHETGRDIHQRALARTVLAEQRVDLTHAR